MQDRSIVKGQLCEWVEVETKTEISKVSQQSQNESMVQPAPVYTSENMQIEISAESSEKTDPLIDLESNSEDMNISSKAVTTNDNQPGPIYSTIAYETASAEIPFDADKPLKSETKGSNQPMGLTSFNNSEAVSLNLGTRGDNNHGKYKCSYCDHKTSKLSFLAQHERTHIGEKLYTVCPCCLKRSLFFETVSILIKHSTMV